MEKDKIFFGESGLTSTSANFIANLAKELYSSAEIALDNLVFYTTTVKLLGSSDESLLKEGVSSVSDVKDTMEMIAELKSLIAWLREAIRAKTRLISEAENSMFSDYGIGVPERPEKEHPICTDDVIAAMNIKQRNRYFYLQSFCATIGNYIHPDGVYANEREQLKKIISEPNTISGSGRDTLLYTRKPSLPVQEVEDTYMHLQQTYREYQAELNSIKHQIEDTVSKDTTEKNVRYAQRMAEYKNTMDVLQAELTAKKKEAIDKASTLKIIIPDSLKYAYERVQSLGKEKQ